MAKLKLTKNELKKQKDNLKMFNRYLPNLVLKKMQLQMEIRAVEQKIFNLELQKEQIIKSFNKWIAVFTDRDVFTQDILKITEVFTKEGNIAGVNIPIFERAEFVVAEYDLIEKPLWLDIAVETVKKILTLDLEMQILEQQKALLGKELKTTTQRVNLFEKIKIPEAKANIKMIRVYLGDQQTAAVVRGKIAKRGMEASQ